MKRLIFLMSLAATPLFCAEPAIPPDEEGAKAALEASPRHGEWADIGGVKTWIVYPERKDKAPVVLVIHEIFGLTDWVRSVADRLAADGYIAVAPDLLSGKGPAGGNTDSVASRDDAVKLVRELQTGEVRSRLDAVRAHALKLPAASGKIAVTGFCWGGARTFDYATHQPGLDAAIVWYGTSPEDPAAFASIKAPVLGLYGGDDARVNTTVAPAAAEMKKLGRTFEHEVYDGAGHGFLRAQSGREGKNLAAARSGWKRMLDFLARTTG